MCARVVEGKVVARNGSLLGIIIFLDKGCCSISPIHPKESSLAFQLLPKNMIYSLLLKNLLLIRTVLNILQTLSDLILTTNL